jgi:hypothetical protein
MAVEKLRAAPPSARAAARSYVRREARRLRCCCAGACARTRSGQRRARHAACVAEGLLEEAALCKRACVRTRRRAKRTVQQAHQGAAPGPATAPARRPWAAAPPSRCSDNNPRTTKKSARRLSRVLTSADVETGRCAVPWCVPPAPRSCFRLSKPRRRRVLARPCCARSREQACAGCCVSRGRVRAAAASRAPRPRRREDAEGRTGAGGGPQLGQLRQRVRSA